MIEINWVASALAKKHALLYVEVSNNNNSISVFAFTSLVLQIYFSTLSKRYCGLSHSIC